MDEANEFRDECIEPSLQESYEHLEQLCGTPNIYRRFEDSEPNSSDSKSPHQHATRIYKYFRNNQQKVCLTLEFDQVTVNDLLSQKKKENRLFNQIRDAYLRDHSTFARHNIRKLFYHFKRILEPDKSSINGLSLNYLTVLFAPIIICVKINDKSNPVLKATIQTAIFQTMYYRINDLFSNIDRTNRINPTKLGTIRETVPYYNIVKGEDAYYEQLQYKENGKYKDDDWLMVRTVRGIGICPKKHVITGNNEQQQTEETTKDDLAEKDVQFYHDFY